MKRSQYLENLPQKRVAVGALFFDNKGNVLILKPGYKKNWTIPGGVVEKNESLTEGLRREVREEIGLELAFKRLLAVEHKIVERNGHKDDSIQFLFFGKTMDVEEIGKIKIDQKEIIEAKFVSKESALSQSSPGLAKRLEHVFQMGSNGKILYIENGEIIN